MNASPAAQDNPARVCGTGRFWKPDGPSSAQPDSVLVLTHFMLAFQGRSYALLSEVLLTFCFSRRTKQNSFFLWFFVVLKTQEGGVRRLLADCGIVCFCLEVCVSELRLCQAEV